VIFHSAAGIEFRVRQQDWEDLDEEVANGRISDWRDEGRPRLNAADPGVRRALESARLLADFVPDDALAEHFEREHDLAFDMNSRRVWDELGLL
jgi:hypothetical protein